MNEQEIEDQLYFNKNIGGDVTVEVLMNGSNEPKEQKEWSNEQYFNTKDYFNLMQFKQFGDLMIYESIMGSHEKDLASDTESQVNENFDYGEEDFDESDEQENVSETFKSEDEHNNPQQSPER